MEWCRRNAIGKGAKPVRRLKVTFIIQKLAGLKGGAERVLCDITTALASRGFEVEILTYERSSEAAGYALSNVQVTNLFPLQKAASETGHPSKPYRLESLIKAVPNLPLFDQVKWSLTYGRFVSRVQAHLRQHQSDITVGVLPAGIIAASRCGQQLAIPSIASIHSTPEQDFGDVERWDPNPVYRRARREALQMADQILVLHPSFVTELPEQLHAKTKVMPNPVLQGNAAANSAQVREKLVVAVGRLVDTKRYQVLVSAWAKLARQFPDWRIEIYGDGPERERLTNLIATHNLDETVILKGVTDDISAVYQRAAIMCHPSEFEGFGLSVAEALSHGVPVVANAACSGVNDLVQDGVSGLLVAANSDQFWIEALTKLLSDPELRERFGSVGRRDMKAFQIEHVADLWVDMLHELAQGNDRSGSLLNF